MEDGRSLADLQRGDEVAVFRSQAASAADVIEICPIQRVTNVFVTLMDGRIYATLGGISLMSRSKTYILPATDEHRGALRAKGLGGGVTTVVHFA